MKRTLISREVDAISQVPGVIACALVDADSGMVWHAADGGASREPVWEAAIGYWRLHHRMRDHFTELGELGAAVLHHHHGVLAILPCAAHEQLLLICLARHGAVDWKDWQRRARELAGNLRNAEASLPP